MINLSWYSKAFRKLHFDYHTPPAVNVVGEGLNVGKFIKKLHEMGCQAFNFFAKDVFGNCYWDTKVGNKHPYLKRDLLGEVVEEAKKYELRVIAYYNVMDLINAQRHPEWSHKGHPNIPNLEGHYVCFNSPWTEKVFLPELRELASYDIDGIFFDFLYVRQPCFCKWCEDRFRKEFKAEIPKSVNNPLWLNYVRWWRSLNDEILKRACEAIHSVNSNILVGVNWAYTPRQPGMPPKYLGYLTLDIDETKCPVLEASYHAKYFDQLNKLFEVMNTRFLRWWGDWGIKPLKQILAECATIMANGGTCIVGDHLCVDGSFEPSVLNLISEVFRFIKIREEYLGGRSIPYVALVLSTLNSQLQRSVLADDIPLRGAHKLLVESGIHHDIVPDFTLIEKLHEYQLIIIPSQRYISQELLDNLKDFVNRGGSLLVTFDTSRGDSNDFMLGDLLGVKLISPTPTELGYILPLDKMLKVGIPEIPIFIKGKFLDIEVKDSKVLANWLRPYIPPRVGLPRYEDWLGAGYGSPIREKVSPSITVKKYGKGLAAYISTDVFRSYYSYSNWMARLLVTNLLKVLVPKRLLEVEAPPYVEVSLRKKNSSIILHLVNWQSGRNPTLPLIAEDIVPVKGLCIRLKIAKRPKSVELFPKEEGELEWSYEEKYMKLIVQKLKVHSMIIINV